MFPTSGRLLGAFRWEAFRRHPGFVFYEISPLGEMLYLPDKMMFKGVLTIQSQAQVKTYFSFNFKILTHWLGQLASNSLWNFWQDEVLSLLSSRHFQSWSLAFQHAFLSAEFGAAITCQRKRWSRTYKTHSNLTRFDYFNTILNCYCIFEFA